MKSDTKIVCLGGGIGTVNLVKGLRAYTDNIIVVVSMADDGGSAGRLRRFYRVPPPGDLVSCISALSDADKLTKSLLTYRFSGDRYGPDQSLSGQKMGNLILVALTAITGDFDQGAREMQRIFRVQGKILPSTSDNISIWARTTAGEKVYREENIDLGRFTGKIDRLFLKPNHPKTSKEVIDAINDADLIVAGPGDLYTTILPVLLVPAIRKAIEASVAKKYYVVNVANKNFETPNYKIEDFIKAIVKHCKSPLFDYFLCNNNYAPKIPKEFSYQYEYVNAVNVAQKRTYKILTADLVDETFPLYHDPRKLARMVTTGI